jgi:uncharacterized protein (DUF302 family)
VKAFEATVDLPLDEAEAGIRAALATEGFGVLTEIDVATTLKAKLGVDRAPLNILGACNPEFADRALQIDPGSRIAAVDPRQLLDDPLFAELATDAAERLERAVGRVATIAA